MKKKNMLKQLLRKKYVLNLQVFGISHDIKLNVEGICSWKRGHFHLPVQNPSTFAFTVDGCVGWMCGIHTKDSHNILSTITVTCVLIRLVKRMY